jgi:hypothetical protein
MLRLLRLAIVHAQGPPVGQIAWGRATAGLSWVGGILCRWLQASKVLAVAPTTMALAIKRLLRGTSSAHPL